MVFQEELRPLMGCYRTFGESQIVFRVLEYSLRVARGTEDVPPTHPEGLPERWRTGASRS